MQLLISIIVPVYNTEEFLPKCLESILAQSYKNIEIVIVDDCSEGVCGDLIAKYQQKDSRIQYIKHEVNKGLFLARETGVKVANGEYVLHVDSDDWIAPHLAQKIIDYSHQSPNLMIYDTLSVKKTRTEKSLWTNGGNRDYQNNTIFESLCVRSFTSWAICGKVFRRDLALKVYNELAVTEHLIMAEDLLFFFAYSYRVYNAVYIPYSGYYYNLTNISVNRMEYTFQKAQTHLDNLKIVVNKINQFVKANQVNSTLYIPVLIELAQTYLVRLLELESQEREKLFAEIQEVFGDSVLFEFIFDDVRRRDYRIYHGIEYLFSKMFPKHSKRYRMLRYLILKVLNLFR